MHFLIISPNLNNIYFIAGFSTVYYSDCSTTNAEQIFVELFWYTNSQNMVWEFLEVVAC